MSDGNGGWEAYRQIVREELRGLNGRVDSLRDHVAAWRVETAREIAALKVKAGIWGGLAGLIPVLLALVVYLLTRGA